MKDEIHSVLKLFGSYCSQNLFLPIQTCLEQILQMGIFNPTDITIMKPIFPIEHGDFPMSSKFSVVSWLNNLH